MGNQSSTKTTTERKSWFGRFEEDEVNKIGALFVQCSEKIMDTKGLVAKAESKRISISELSRIFEKTVLGSRLKSKSNLKTGITQLFDIQDGYVSFEEYVTSLEVLIKGTIPEKVSKLCMLQKIIAISDIIGILHSYSEGIYAGYQSSLKYKKKEHSPVLLGEYLSSILPHIFDDFDHSFKTVFLHSVSPAEARNMSKLPSSILSTSILDAISLSADNDVFSKPGDILYSSVDQGLSFIKLVESLLHYPAETLIVFKDRDSNLFGVLNRSEYKESSTFVYNKVGLFAIYPKFQALNMNLGHTEGNTYLNLRNKMREKLLCFGGAQDGNREVLQNTCRFLIDEDFEKCRSREVDMCFERGAIRPVSTDMGALLDESLFKIDSVEVFGFGGDQAKQLQAKQREELLELINERRKVDKKQFVSNSFDKEYLLGKTFGNK